jgi:hypothetical protein
MLHGDGIPRAFDFPAGARQAHHCRVDANSEYGRDLDNRGSLDVLAGFHEGIVRSKAFPLQAVHIHMHSILSSNSALPRC